MKHLCSSHRIFRHRMPRPGFTIIEIMVAILLLSSALVAIFGAQFSAVASTNFARNITQATQLGRCKMSELELLILEDGFQEGDVDESGECCEFMEDEMSTDFRCTWEVKTIVLPDMTEMMSGGDDDDTDGDGGGIGDMLGGGEEGDDMADMGMEMFGTFVPMLADLLQQAMRRVTVRVEWTQGSREKHVEFVQYVVNPDQGVLKLLNQTSTEGR